MASRLPMVMAAIYSIRAMAGHIYTMQRGLVKRQANGNIANKLSQTYQYNKAGQVTNRNLSDHRFMWFGAPKNETYQVNALNQYTEVTQSDGSITTPNYDKSGNLKNMGNMYFAYSAEACALLNIFGPYGETKFHHCP